MYLKPKLKDLSQGARSAFVKQFRQLTQDDFADELNVEQVRNQVKKLVRK